MKLKLEYMNTLKTLLSIALLSIVLFSCSKPDEVVPMTPIEDPNKSVDLLEGKYENINDERHYRLEFSHIRTVTLSGYYREEGNWLSLKMQSFNVNASADRKSYLARDEHGHLHDQFEIIDDNTVRSKVTKIAYTRVDNFTEPPLN